MLHELGLTAKEEEATSWHNEGLSQQAVADKMGISRASVRKHLNNATIKSIHQGTDPGFIAKKKTRGRWYKDPVTGESRVEYIKMDSDKEAVGRLLEEAMQGFKDKLPRVKASKLQTAKSVEQLLNCIILTDYHLGMLAWGEETGADWDLKIAEELVIQWFNAAIQQSPKAQVGLFAQLGDFLHFDGIEAVTPTSGNILDADTRFAKLVRVAIRVIRTIIDMMLKKYPFVHIIMAEGNHDLASSIWLREMLAIMYENEPRISVDTSPDPYYCYEWGKTALFFHHGHKRKPVNVDTAFAGKFREVFGRTLYAYAHMGHLHHRQVIEGNLMEVEQHPTLAANDAYGARLGHTSKRRAAIITYHKEYGEVASNRMTPEMLK